MRQQYTMVNDWHNCVKDLKENHDKELKKFRTINDEVSTIFDFDLWMCIRITNESIIISSAHQLFQQNYDLQAKVAELQHLAELSRKTRLQNDAEQINALKSKNEQLEGQLQNLKLELANAIAMKVDTDEAHRESIKQNDQQNVKLLAIQELYKNATAEIASLKAQSDGPRRELEQIKSVAADYQDQINVLQAQVRGICLRGWAILFLAVEKKKICNRIDTDDNFTSDFLVWRIP